MIELRHQRRERRYAILAEGWFANRHAKTAHGLVRYGKDEVVAVIDSTLAGQTTTEALPDLRRSAPIVSGIDEALAYEPTSLLVGLAPAGGRLPGEWLAVLRRASEAGVEVVSGLHQRLAPELPGAEVWDVRDAPEGIPLFSGEGFDVGPKVVHAVGTSSAIGKMTATLEIERAAGEAGTRTAFVATGQTGIVIEGWGISVDAVVSDFAAGAAEQLVLEAARGSVWEGDRRVPDLILVEGQGSLGHPAYSGVTLSLMHGSCPDALILCADAASEEVFPRVPMPDLSLLADRYEGVAALTKPAPVVAVSINTRGLDEETAREYVERVSHSTGRPATDPVRFGAEPILAAIGRAPKTRVGG